MVEEKKVLTPQIVEQIIEKDYSYVLVYKEKRGNITGVIKVKEFALKYLKSTSSDMIACEVMKQNTNMLIVC